MKWNDDFWKVKQNSPFISVSGKDAVDLFKKGHQLDEERRVTFDKWLKRAIKISSEVRSAGYKPLVVTIRMASLFKDRKGGINKEAVKEYLDANRSYKFVSQVYIIDIYADIPESSPIGRALRRQMDWGRGYWLRVDYNCSIGGKPTYIFEVLLKGATTFSHSDYTGYLVGNGFGNSSIQPIKQEPVRLQTYDEAWQ